MIMFGTFKTTETRLPFEYGIGLAAVVGSTILYSLAATTVFYSQRRRQLRPVRKQPKITDSTPEVAVVLPEPGT